MDGKRKIVEGMLDEMQGKFNKVLSELPLYLPAMNSEPQCSRRFTIKSQFQPFIDYVSADENGNMHKCSDTYSTYTDLETRKKLTLETATKPIFLELS